VLESAEDVGVVVAPTLTPREAVARLDRTRGMSAAGSEALERIGRAVEAEGYGPPGPADRARRAGLADDLATVLACLRAGIDGNGRIRATMLPPSLVARATNVVSRFA
jgi:hypothetical protein